MFEHMCISQQKGIALPNIENKIVNSACSNAQRKVQAELWSAVEVDRKHSGESELSAGIQLVVHVERKVGGGGVCVRETQLGVGDSVVVNFVTAAKLECRSFLVVRLATESGSKRNVVTVFVEERELVVRQFLLQRERGGGTVFYVRSSEIVCTEEETVELPVRGLPQTQ
jgi:hypothetical protein